MEYKSGPGAAVVRPNSPHNWALMDQATEGGDYSRRTFGIAQWLAEHLKW